MFAKQETSKMKTDNLQTVKWSYIRQLYNLEGIQKISLNPSIKSLCESNHRHEKNSKN